MDCKTCPTCGSSLSAAHEFRKECKRCHRSLPESQFGEGRGICLSCRNEQKRQNNRAARKRAPKSAFGLLTEADIARFWLKVDKDGPEKIPSSPCWVWTASATSHWYGQFYAAGKLRPAHCTSWEMANKRPLAKGEDCCHKCDYPPCVRPDHLFPASHRENLLDASRKGRMAHGPRLPWTKLTAEQVRSIRAQSNEGVSGNQLAREHGVHPNAIYQIIHRISWKHITP